MENGHEELKMEFHQQTSWNWDFTDDDLTSENWDLW